MTIEQAARAGHGPASATHREDRREVRVCLHQPNFLPWAKLIDKIAACDRYIAYDSVQYTRTEFHSRQRINGRQGPVWLSVPVVGSGRHRERLADTLLTPGDSWRQAHLRLLTEHYRKAPFFEPVMQTLRAAYDAPHTHLVDFNLDVLSRLLQFTGTQVEVLRAIDLPHQGDNTERVIQLTQAAGGTVHVTSTYGSERRYVDWEQVAAAGIVVETQVFSEPEYASLHAPVEGLSVVDLLFSVGPDAGRLLARRRQLQRVLAPWA